MPCVPSASRQTAVRCRLEMARRPARDRCPRATAWSPAARRDRPGDRWPTRCRLVEEQQFRIADQGNRDVQPPLLAPGQLEHPGIALLLEADQADDLIDRPRARLVGGVHGNGLAHGEVPVDAGGLQHDPDPALQFRALSAGVQAKNADLAAVTGAVALENLDRGGLARPVRAEQRENLALADRQVDPR